MIEQKQRTYGFPITYFLKTKFINSYKHLYSLNKKKKKIEQCISLYRYKCICTVGQKKNTKHSYLFQCKLSYRKKLVPIIMDYCLFQFNAIKFFLRVRLHGGSLPNFNFFNENPQIF